MSKVNVDVVETSSIDTNSPYVFIGLPDAGLVGKIAATYLVDCFNLKEVGYIDSERFPPVVIVQRNEVKYPIRMYAKDKFVVVISDIPLAPSLSIPFSSRLLSWVKKLEPELVINITGLPVQNRIQLKKPEVLGLTTNKAMIELLRTRNVSLFSDGVLFGPYAAIIKESVSQKIPSLTLFTQSHLNFPDPIASIEALSIVNKVLETNIDLKALQDEAEMIRIKTRELMRQTKGALEETKIEGTDPAIYR